MGGAVFLPGGFGHEPSSVPEGVIASLLDKPLVLKMWQGGEVGWTGRKN